MKLTKLFGGGEERGGNLNASLVFFLTPFSSPEWGPKEWYVCSVRRRRKRAREKKGGGGEKEPEILVIRKKDGASTLCKSTTLLYVLAFRASHPRGK